MIVVLANGIEAKAPKSQLTSFEPIVWDYPTLPEVLFVGDNGQCVNYARELSKIDYSGNAIDWGNYINSQSPDIGAVVLFNVGRFGHLAVVVALYEDHFVISERNYYGLYIINERKVLYNDDSIVGFIRSKPDIEIKFEIKQYAKI